MSARIQELSVPKGNVCPFCEICGQKATIRCDNCKRTYYCTEYHKTIDLESFHPIVCEKIEFVRKDHPLPFTEEDRSELNKTILDVKRDIQLLAEITAKRWLLEHNAELAYPAAMIALNFAKDLNESKAIEVVYPTCLVSESYYEMRDMKSAEYYMILASWLSQNYDIISPTIIARLQRLVGLICMRNNRWKQAREAFAELIYAISVEHGTENIRMAIAYGYLGLTLLHFGEEVSAMASFHKMADKWLEYLLKQYEQKTIRSATEVEIISEEKLRELEFQFLESKTVFKWVYEAVRHLGMNEITDNINFKILCVQSLSLIRESRLHETKVYIAEALATSIRTKQEKAVSRHNLAVLMEVLGDDFIKLWEKKNNRPRTVATKYLERIKAINV